MGLLAKNGRAEGKVRLGETHILGLPLRALNRVRGSRLAMVFQDPMTSLNPYLKVGRQMSEVLVVHKGLDGRTARASVLQMMERVRISDGARRMGMYPYELSGGMRQRVMIAMALLCEPQVLVADEPTTALDVTVQAEIMALLREVSAVSNTSIVLISHDLSLVAGLCDRVVVLYGGRVVETGQLEDIFYRSQHPYTLGLLAAMPRFGQGQAGKLKTITGQPPDPLNSPPGCAFQDRCPHRIDQCALSRPELKAVADGHSKACHLEREKS
jgi:oligopeptide transport system ATP-binding protein